MTQTVSSGLNNLRAGIKGEVITPEDSGYDEARKVWNASHDRRPAVMVQCSSAEDVATAIGYAVDSGLEIAVRGGAHSFPGASTCDGLVIDLRTMNSVTVDPEPRRVRVGGGALLGDVDAATQEHGLAVPAGIVSHTGVGGLTLGGGLGWLTRVHGLTLDNLVSAQVVLADQRIVRAAEDENPELFWALRGGGGNFGVVTEFEFRLHKVGPMVHFGLFFWPLEQQREALQLMKELSTSLPAAAGAYCVAVFTAPPAPFVPVEHHGKLGCVFNVAGFGDPAEIEAIADQIRTTLPPLFDLVTPMPFVALQQSIDPGNAWGFYAYEKGAFFAEINDDMIEILNEYAARRTSPLTYVAFLRLDQAYSAVADDVTAFAGGRTPRYQGYLTGVCPTPEMLDTERAWIRSLWDALKPHMIGTEAYLNSRDAQGEDEVRKLYGPKYERLAEMKCKYDPQNLFHRNANIVPAV